MNSKVIGTGCEKCDALYKNVQNAIKELDIDAEIEKVEDLIDIVKLGVMTSPSLMVDGKLVISGRVAKMEDVGFAWTIVLSFCVGLVLSSAFPAILLYAQELLPYKLGLISGLFFGFAFGVAGIASAVLGNMADHYGIEAVYNVCGFMPLLGLVTWFLPNLKKK